MAFHIKVDNRTSGPTDTGPAGGSVRSWSKNQTFNGQTFFHFLSVHLILILNAWVHTNCIPIGSWEMNNGLKS